MEPYAGTSESLTGSEASKRGAGANGAVWRKPYDST